MFERPHHQRIAHVLGALDGDATVYRELRGLVTGPAGINALVRPGAQPLMQQREVRADQYGVRTVVLMDSQANQFEIVREARIDLETPGPADVVCGISTLTPLDLATSQLLAKAIDRLQERPGWLERCMQVMAMTQPKAVIWQKIRALRRVLKTD